MVTKNKYFLIFILFLGWLIASLDRAVMSFVMIPLANEFSLDSSLTGVILSAFFLGFILVQIPAGYLADRWGARKVLLVAVVSWSVFTGLTGLAWSVTSLIVLRFLFGLFEGFFPSASSIAVAENFPLTQRARAKTVVLLGSGIGQIVAAVAGVALLASVGWRSLFGLLGAFGLVIFILYWFGLARKKEAEANNSVKQVPVRAMLKNPLIWSLTITSMGIYIVNWGIASWMPIYLVQSRGLSMTEMGTLVAISGFVMLLSSFAVAYILDKFTGKERYFVVGGAVLAAVFLYLLAIAPTPVMAVVYQTLAQITCSFVTFTVLTQPLKRFPKESIGTANGIVNMGGQIGSFISPMAVGFIVNASGGSYYVAFIFLAACVLVSAVAGATIPVIKTPDTSKQEPDISKQEPVAGS
ncbi:MFS transporter [Paenibacillus sp. WQ 127069]|uniref:MFS transporter n=1 Tax=Paenibacillus baimaensis TaxID=2982185 RepID=A0ABT2UD02_9BACL|nr:MFS transporter [Paenibacillus sp. WQ 127069]MCU6792511.1 MFS transporter [Paenibacillus sp. WQ 127069]